MKYIIVGLGNPGNEYEKTRHNAGRMALDFFWRSRKEFTDWLDDNKHKALISEGAMRFKNKKTKSEEDVFLIKPNNFMNNSGKCFSHLINGKKQAARVIVLYDDLDLPIGTFKIAFNRGSGGHKGVESVIRSLKTKEFIRIRIGISPTTPSGAIRKPKGEKKVLDFIMKKFTPAEEKLIKKTAKRITEALGMIIAEDIGSAMNVFNRE